MAEPTGGPSLVQDPELAPNSDDHSTDPDTTFAERTDSDSSSGKRELTDSSDSLITEIHRTVSLIHVVRPDGTPIEVKTVYSSPTTLLVDPTTGKVVEVVTGNSAGAAADSVIPTPPLVTDLPPGDGDLIPSDIESLVPTDLDVISPLSNDLLSSSIPEETASVSTSTGPPPDTASSGSSAVPTIAPLILPSGRFCNSLMAVCEGKDL